MSVRLTLFFRSPDGYGWSETYNYNGGTSDPTMLTNLNILINARIGILTSSCVISHARVATTTKRNPRIFALTPTSGVAGLETPPTDAEEVALMVRLNAGITNFNRIFVRGIPERVTQANSYIPDSTFAAEMLVYLTLLQSGLYNAVGTIGSPTVTFPMGALTPLLPRGYSFTLPTPALTVGQRIHVKLSKIFGYNGFKTVTQIIAVTPPIIHVGGASPNAPDTTGSPVLSTVTVQDNPITAAFVQGVTRRAAGRPFGPSRGRRQTVLSLRQ
jgi:hypothetical protein